MFVDPLTIEKFWVPRAEMVKLLLDKALKDDNITVMFNAACSAISEGHDEDGLLKVIGSIASLDDVHDGLITCVR